MFTYVNICNRNMKIMYVLTDWAIGGAEIEVLRMCNFMQKSGHRVVVVSMMKPEASNMVEKLKDLCIDLYTLNMERGKADINSFLHFVKLVKLIKPDVVHSHMIHANFLLRASSPFLEKTIKINTIHGEEEYKGKRKLIYRITDNLVDYTVCCGKILYNQALELKLGSTKRLRYICNGLDTMQYMYCNDVYKNKFREENNIQKKFVWISVGRLNTVKNQAYLLSEFKKILCIYPETVLLVVGDGPLKGALQNQIKQLNIVEQVHLLGQRDDVNKILSVADAFVLSSIHEGLPLSLQEAGAAGLPLVSTDVGGCNEVIEDGKNGYLCENNKEKQLFEKMLLIMEKPEEERRKMGEYSKKIVFDKFDIKNIMTKWEQLYNRVV